MFGRLLLKGMETTVVGPFLGYGIHLGLSSVVGAALFLACVALACVGDGRRMRVMLGVSILCAGVFATIAIGRAQLAEFLTMRSKVPLTALELAPRYFYAATIPLVIIWCVGLAGLTRRFTIPAVLWQAAVAVWLVAVSVFLSVRPLGIDRHDEARIKIETALQSIRTRIAAGVPGSIVVLPARPFEFNIPLVDPPGWLALFTIFFPSDIVDGRQVVFAVSDPKLLAATIHGRRTASLVRPARPGIDPAR